MDKEVGVYKKHNNILESPSDQYRQHYNQLRPRKLLCESPTSEKRIEEDTF